MQKGRLKSKVSDDLSFKSIASEKTHIKSSSEKSKSNGSATIQTTHQPVIPFALPITSFKLLYELRCHLKIAALSIAAGKKEKNEKII